MTDRVMVRMLEETCSALSDMHPYEPCKYLLPSYNALLLSARANHPEDTFLTVLPAIDPQTEEKISSGNLRVLFTQLRIALEAMIADQAPGGSEVTRPYEPAR